LARTTVLGTLLLGVLAAAVFYADRLARVPAAYMAKALCSEVFLAARNPIAVAEQEFDGISPAIDRASASIDADARRVTASLFGLGRTRASFRDGYGCTIERGKIVGLPALAPVGGHPWPQSLPDTLTQLRRVDYPEIDAALDHAFADKSAGHRAFVAIVDGRVVGERYAPGFSAATPMLSWSMAKSVTASLVGAAVLDGYIDLDVAAPVPEWQDDPKRGAITWNDLLRMQSGLAFNEDYGDPNSDVSEMLFRARDAGAVAAKKRLAAEPGTVWSYSSGTTNLLMRTLRQALAKRGVELQAYAREKIFAPIGAASFILEPDSSGTPVGSSYIYATARDWAKLGELYRNDGAWNGARLLPEGWSQYVSTPTKGSDGEYGAHFWLNRDGEGRRRYVPELSENVYFMAGHEGQYVFIIPDKNTVIVRLGMTRGRVPIEAAGPVAAEIAGAVDDIVPAEEMVE